MAGHSSYGVTVRMFIRITMFVCDVQVRIVFRPSPNDVLFPWNGHRFVIRTVTSRHVFSQFQRILRVRTFVPLIRILTMPMRGAIICFANHLSLSVIRARDDFVRLIPNRRDVREDIRFRVRIRCVVTLKGLHYVFRRKGVKKVPFKGG